MAASIQFSGVDQVMTAFQNRDVDAWSVWQHRQFMFKGMGDADLRTLLDNLASGSGNAIYTIKVYEGITNLSEIKEKTQCDGSFNFRLNDERQEIRGAQYSSLYKLEDLRNEIAELKQRLEETVEEPPEEKTIGSVLVEVIEDPQKVKQWVEILQGIFTGKKPVQELPPTIEKHYSQPTQAAMGNTETIMTEEEKEVRFLNAINILEKNDPKLVIHLEKLAKISEEKPAKFKGLLSMLEFF